MIVMDGLCAEGCGDRRSRTEKRAWAYWGSVIHLASFSVGSAPLWGCVSVYVY
jgi:hypothetical protein